MTQIQTVLTHLTNNRKITSIEAIGLYGITRLAAVVYTLNKQGISITTTMKTGVKAPYAEYSLEK
jgi:hypothetical protein